MTTKLEHALALAAENFWIFPLLPGRKTPGKGMTFKELATRDTLQIHSWWAASPESNIGIYTGRYGDSEALVVVDIDNKNGKRGDDAILQLELDGFELPYTRTSHTPSGGRHMVYRSEQSCRQGANVLGRGVDIRSRGGFIVGPGSRVMDGEYLCDPLSRVEVAPSWLVARLADNRERAPTPKSAPPSDQAATRAIRYLENDAPLAVEGNAGDETTYKVAARLKDIGVDGPTATALMLDHWNARCSPPWEPADLVAKVVHAYKYGQNAIGSAAPEAVFTKADDTENRINADYTENSISPHAKLNAEYAYILAGGGDHVLWETTDSKGRFSLQHLNINTFHRKHAADKIQYGNKTVPLTEDWMEWKGRRQYDGLVFLPEREAPVRFYNLWRGYGVSPLAPGDVPTATATAAVNAFFEHALVNVCNGDKELNDWLIGYFAHLVQRPWEKPLVALVFKGAKGTGKNALLEHGVGALLGNHFLVADSDRYLLSHFNGHMENLLLFVLDEAAWAGDKRAEGRLKGLITGSQHVIEHKGEKPYTVDNLTRIAIIGNEDWLVPASYDERRFAVFDVGEGRKQDRAFFQALREGMAAGGSSLLLRVLLETPISSIDVNRAPATRALLDQKHATLDPVSQWWLASISEGRIAGGDFEGWPSEVERERFRGAFRRYAREHNVRSRLPDDTHFGRAMKRCGLEQGRLAAGYTYRVPSLAECRKFWDRHIGQETEWSTE